MQNVDIIRAWKDEDYRLSLTTEQLAALPANPAGEIELVEADLEEVVGGLHKGKKGAEPAPAGGSAGTSAGTSAGGSAGGSAGTSAGGSAGTSVGGTSAGTSKGGTSR